MSRPYLHTVNVEPHLGRDGRGSKYRWDPVMSEDALKAEMAKRASLAEAKNELSDKLKRFRSKQP